jgi:hypothetical protein
MVAREGAGAATAVKTVGTITIEGPNIGTISFPIEKVTEISEGYAIRAPHTSDEAEIRRASHERLNPDTNQPKPEVTKVNIVAGESQYEMKEPRIASYDGAAPDVFRFELIQQASV